MYSPPPNKIEATKIADPAREKSWQEEAEAREKQAAENDKLARQNVVYLAKGPIVAAIVLGNLVTAGIIATIVALLHLK